MVIRYSRQTVTAGPGTARHPCVSRPIEREALDQIVAALSQLRFGEVVIAVHDGEIVQITRTEKLRFARRETR